MEFLTIIMHLQSCSMGEISIAPLNLNLGPGQSDKKLNFKIGMPPTIDLGLRLICFNQSIHANRWRRDPAFFYFMVMSTKQLKITMSSNFL